MFIGGIVMKNYKKKMSIILSLLCSLNISKPITKGSENEISTIDIHSNDASCLDLYDNKKIVCLNLDLDDDDDDMDSNNTKKTVVSKPNSAQKISDKNIQIHNVINVMVDGVFSPTHSLQGTVKNRLHSVVDSFTSPSSLCRWLASLIATRYLSNIADIFFFDPSLKKDVLKEAEEQSVSRDKSNWNDYYNALKKIYSGLGWIDPRENGIKSRMFSTSYNYLDYTSYLALSEMFQKDINEISYRRIMADKNATNWVYILAWNHILQKLGFATKIYKIKSDEYFFNQEYVIVFAKKLDETVKINLLTPFLAKRTNEVDKLFSEKVLEGILENSTNSQIVLEDVDDSSDTISLKIGGDIANYFKYDEHTKLLSKK